MSTVAHPAVGETVTFRRNGVTGTVVRVVCGVNFGRVAVEWFEPVDGVCVSSISELDW